MIYVIFFTLTMIIIDIVTGIVKGVKLKTFDSKKLRQGGLNKLAEVIAVVFGYTVERALPYFQVKFDFSICILICTYLFFMECASVIENIGTVNPEIIPPKIKELFKQLNERGDE